MVYDVTINGRQLAIGVETDTATGEYVLSVDGQRRVMNVSWIDADTLSLIEAGVSYEMRIHPRAAGAAGIECRGTLVEAEVAKQARVPLASSGVPNTSAAPAASRAVRAPMPGRVVRVLVAVGDRVAARQGVAIVEAMKMENELRSPIDGLVKEIAVSAGAPVDSGAVLVVIGD